MFVFKKKKKVVEKQANYLIVKCNLQQGFDPVVLWIDSTGTWAPLDLLCKTHVQWF